MVGLTQFYRRMRFGDPIVVVSGLPRSGTSMAMKMLEAAGLDIVTDGRREADIDNPKGYYEEERVKDLGEQTDRSWLRASRGRVIKVISSLLRHLPDDNNYNVVLMHRNLKEVLASQAKMLDNRGEAAATGDERMVELFEDEMWRAKYLLRHRRWFDFVEVHYADVLGDARTQADRIARFLGGGLDVDKMAAVVDDKLYRNRA